MIRFLIALDRSLCVTADPAVQIRAIELLEVIIAHRDGAALRGAPCWAEYHAGWSTMPRGIPCLTGYHAVLNPKPGERPGPSSDFGMGCLATIAP